MSKRAIFILNANKQFKNDNGAVINYREGEDGGESGGGGWGGGVFKYIFCYRRGGVSSFSLAKG